ncbi:collagen alpha-1(III) chain-like [Homalodisca vitripennis]|uniref:collagen alpha-1(III) chain-like n=1 Tax=Homalodisca vitripennis TaxID=197043 RepID=UPI001EECAFA7|nr:collagen alpha-1(III) chain-like [Homalodisca vitripennis]
MPSADIDRCPDGHQGEVHQRPSLGDAQLLQPGDGGLREGSTGSDDHGDDLPSWPGNPSGSWGAAAAVVQMPSADIDRCPDGHQGEVHQRPSLGDAQLLQPGDGGLREGSTGSDDHGDDLPSWPGNPSGSWGAAAAVVQMPSADIDRCPDGHQGEVHQRPSLGDAQLLQPGDGGLREGSTGSDDHGDDLPSWPGNPSGSWGAAAAVVQMPSADIDRCPDGHQGEVHQRPSLGDAQLLQPGDGGLREGSTGSDDHGDDLPSWPGNPSGSWGAAAAVVQMPSADIDRCPDGHQGEVHQRPSLGDAQLLQPGDGGLREGSTGSDDHGDDLPSWPGNPSGSWGAAAAVVQMPSADIDRCPDGHQGEVHQRPSLGDAQLLQPGDGGLREGSTGSDDHGDDLPSWPGNPSGSWGAAAAVVQMPSADIDRCPDGHQGEVHQRPSLGDAQLLQPGDGGLREGSTGSDDHGDDLPSWPGNPSGSWGAAAAVVQMPSADIDRCPDGHQGEVHQRPSLGDAQLLQPGDGGLREGSTGSDDHGDDLPSWPGNPSGSWGAAAAVVQMPSADIDRCPDGHQGEVHQRPSLGDAQLLQPGDGGLREGSTGSDDHGHDLPSWPGNPSGSWGAAAGEGDIDDEDTVSLVDHEIRPQAILPDVELLLPGHGPSSLLTVLFDGSHDSVVSILARCPAEHSPMTCPRVSGFRRHRRHKVTLFLAVRFIAVLVPKVLVLSLRASMYCPGLKAFWLRSQWFPNGLFRNQLTP